MLGLTELLTEWTQGYPVRAFVYDGAGRMIQARVFTQTTEFVYNGLGARLAVSVDGYGTTLYTLDYAAGNRILAETTPTETVSYLYGHDCLGEQRDDEWLYYLPDAEGYVRQGTDADGAIVSAWLFDPDGTVLEGPAGPVSHLVCGGVYDWSTGLIYQDGQYFDPMLGIWLALMPLAVFQGWKKKRKGGHPWVMLTLCLVGISGMLVACGTTCSGPSIDPPSACTEVVSFEQPLGNNAVFVGPPAGSQLPEYPEAITWDPAERQVVEETLTNVLDNKFGGSTGFGSLNVTLTELGISTNNPLVLVRRVEEPLAPGSGAPAAACKPYIYVHDAFFTCDQGWQETTLGHEMAHFWDDMYNRKLNTEMANWINLGDTPTDYETSSDREVFAEAVKVYFWSEYDQGREWTDDMGAGLVLANDPTYGGKGRDGLRLAPNYRDFPLADNRRLSATGTEQVYDRYDYLECRFTGSCLKPLP